MVKLTFCLRRQAHLTPEEFSRYWREVHAPLVRARAELLGIRRYVQVHTADEPELHEVFRRRNGGAPLPFDGIAELWFDDVEAFRRPRSEEARHAARELLEDERRFIDLAASPMWLGQEWDVLATP
ncbi:MAG: EthD domain-containing protein [Chloroflexota bacterium]|nr:EthD domain-containing protein [Chloroflexota bacterium]